MDTNTTSNMYTNMNTDDLAILKTANLATILIFIFNELQRYTNANTNVFTNVFTADFCKQAVEAVSTDGQMAE